MWSSEKPCGTGDMIGPFEMGKILYFFDEPVLFTAMVGRARMIFLQHAETDMGTLFLAAPISEGMVGMIEAGILPLRNAFEGRDCLIMEMDLDHRIRRFWDCPPGDIPSDMLPAKGVPLVRSSESYLNESYLSESCPSAARPSEPDWNKPESEERPIQP